MTHRLETLACVAIGDELLEGRHPDLNSAVVAEAFGRLGVDCRGMHVVSDEEESLAELFVELCSRHSIVVTTGGLGPTLDDVTRHAAARAAGVELEESAEARAHLEQWSTRIGRELPAANLRQALIPRDAELLHNAHGTAPGFVLELGSGLLACLPGPPRELVGVLRDAFLPWIEQNTAAPVCTVRAEFFLLGLPESEFAERVGAWMERGAQPLMGVSAKDGVLHVRISARSTSEAVARELVDGRAAELRAMLGPFVYSEGAAHIEEVVGRRLIEAGLTVATAESCTGGLVAERLTRVPGISAVFSQGFVTYANEAKVARLGVDRQLLERVGAVSSEVAAAMAEGAAKAAGSRLAVSTTGIAGPDGGSEEKPVGLVWFGVYRDGRVETHERRFPDFGRVRIRQRAAQEALLLLDRAAADIAAQPD